MIVPGNASGVLAGGQASDERWERSADFVADPILSALVFVYGAERFMRGLLDDLLAQTILPRMEIVIVDTGSPTGEAAIVREHLARHPNIAYLRTEERETTTAAANRCIRAARGKYLTLACADDRHRKDALERLVDVLERDPGAALAYADVAVTDTENETFERATVVGHFRWPDFDPVRLFQVCHVGPQPVYRRRLHEQHGLYDPAYVTAGDYEFWLRVVARGERFVHVPEVLGLYLRSQSSNEHANQGLSLAESEKARIVHWPAAWGARPPAGGSYFVPAPVVTPAPSAVAPTTTVTAALHGAPASPAARKAPLVSVIMPTFERPEFLPRAVQSVLAQTCRDLELIVVNDGGAPVEDLLAPLDPDGRITSVRLGRNRNRSAARNVALAIARGRYVAYLDDDDWFRPEHLELLVGTLETTGGAVAYSFADRVHEERRGTEWVQTAVTPAYRFPFHAAALLVGNYIPLPCLVHRRDCIAEVGGFDEDMQTHEDWDLLIRLAARHPFHQVEQATCCFSWREDGSSTTSRLRDDFARTQALVYERYAELAARIPGVREAQQKQLAAAAQRAGAMTTTAIASTAPPAGAPQRTTEATADARDAAPACTIVLPLHDRVALTRQCLTALAEVTDEDVELVLIDDGSTDGTAQLLDELSSAVRVIRNERHLGFARACNQGAAVARGRHLLFLANDTVPLRGWLRPLLDALETRPELAIVGSRLLHPDGTLQHAGMTPDHLGQAQPLYANLPAGFAPANRPRELQAVSTACMLVRREAFEAVGGFDEGYVDALAGVDLCLRIRERGGRVLYEPRSALIRLQDASARRERDVAASAARLAKRWQHVSLADQASLLLEDGLVLRVRDLDDRPRAELAELPVDERPAWGVVAEAERRAATAGFAAVAPLLADAAAWPADPAVLHWAASELCPRAGVPDRAIAFWTRLLDLEENVAARTALASDALANGDLDAAERHLVRALDRRPADAAALVVRGVLELQRERFAAAREAFRSARASGGDARKCALGLGMAALGAGDAEDAWSLFADLVRERPDDAEAVHWLLRAGCVLERWRGLRPFLEASVVRAPRDPSLRFALAGIHVRLGELDAAREAYEVLRVTAPQLEGLEGLAAAIEQRAGRTESAAAA